MKVVIVIDGESAESLSAVGCADMREHFIPKGLNIEKSDIKKIMVTDYREKKIGDAYTEDIYERKNN